MNAVVIFCIVLVAQANALLITPNKADTGDIVKTQTKPEAKLLTMIGQYTTYPLNSTNLLQHSFMINVGDLGMTARIAVVAWGSGMDSAVVRVCFNGGSCLGSYTLSSTNIFFSFMIDQSHFAKQMQIYMYSTSSKLGSLTYQIF